jgi:hypothetical protein
MAETKNIVGYDFDTIKKDGSDNLTQALMELLNSYEGLNDVPSDYIEFQLLDTTKGIAMFPNPSVAILTEQEDIVGHVTQTCAYAFTIVFRTRTTDKEYVKEWLDNLGRWLEETEYPALTENKKFLKIARNTQSYLYGTTEDKAEDWAISIQATYRNEFDR